MKMTSIANEQTGMKATNFPIKKYPTSTKIPVKILETFPTAPELTFNDDLVKDPEAGMPEKIAQAKFPIPKEIVSLFSSIRDPCLDARDFPMESPSIRHNRDNAKEACKMTSHISKELVIFGKERGMINVSKSCKYEIFSPKKGR